MDCNMVLDVIRFLRKKHVIKLAATCSATRKALKPWIENNVLFSGFMNYETLTPRVLTIQMADIEKDPEGANLLPNSNITKLQIGSHEYVDRTFGFVLRKLQLPPGLKDLSVGRKIYVPRKTIAQQPLKRLRIADQVNFQLSECFPLPASLEEFRAGCRFDSPVDTLPPCLTILHLSGSFNQPVDKLPSSLKELYLADLFNQPVNNLPSGLTILALSSQFDHPLDALPKSLKTLMIRSWLFTYPLDCLPDGLERLVIISAKYTHGLDKLPQSIVHLSIRCESLLQPLCALPMNLKSLVVAGGFNQAIILPRSLLAIYIDGPCFDQPLVLPPQLESFTLKHVSWSHASECTLPTSLAAIEFPCSKVSTRLPLLPSRLEILQLPEHYNHPIELPLSLRILLCDPASNVPTDHLARLEVVSNAKRQPKHLSRWYPKGFLPPCIVSQEKKTLKLLARIENTVSYKK